MSGRVYSSTVTIRDVFRPGEEEAVVHSGQVPGSSEGDRVPSEALVPVLRCHVVPRSLAAMADDEAHEPVRKPSFRSAWTSAPMASTSAPSSRRCGLCWHDGCTSQESSTPHCERTSPGSRVPIFASQAAANHRPQCFKVGVKLLSSFSPSPSGREGPPHEMKWRSR